MTTPELAVMPQQEIDAEDETRDDAYKAKYGEHWDQVVENDDGSLTVDLYRPKIIKGKEFKFVDFKAEPTGADVLASQQQGKDTLEQTEILVERMTGIDRKNFRQLHSADYLMIATIAGIHMGNASRIAGKSS